MPVTSASEQAEVNGTIEPTPEYLELGTKNRKTRKSRTNRTR